ncbi:MAG: hypothetical protein ACI33P_05290 [Lysinibacillus sp.]
MSKMRILKWLLLSLGVVILLGGSYVLYEFKFKTYDIADEEVDGIVEEGYEIELPDGTTMKIGKDGKIIEENNEATAKAEEAEVEAVAKAETEKKDENNVPVANAAPKESTTSPANTVPPAKEEQTETVVKEEEPVKKEAAPAKPANPQPSNNPPAAKPAPVTAESIREKYRGTFVSLEEQAEARVNNLVAAAKKEYTQKKANGEKVSAGYFYTKYMNSSSALEESTDAAFENLMKVVEADLVANGFNKSESKSFRTEYEQAKEQRRSALMKKALEEIK